MPVTFAVTPVAAEAVYGDERITDAEILSGACKAQFPLCKEILQSSITDEERSSLYPETNGFVRTVLSAYACHRHLVLRPDDVWIAILTQLCFYFTYRIVIICGIPTITLLGTQSDWLSLLRRLDRLPTLGPEPAAWARMLRPVLRRFVEVFDNPEQPDLEFWRSVVYRRQEMCGQDDLSGWLTAFCVWNHNGVWKAGRLPDLPAMQDNEPAAGNHEKSLEKMDEKSRSSFILPTSPQAAESRKINQFDESDARESYCEVDVIVDDNGVRLNCNMIAGHVAGKVLKSEPDGKMDTLTPSAQWFIYEKW
ncbi:hypothetical protein BN946_scf184940.g98, partial [Trametes cinnabarina]